MEDAADAVGTLETTGKRVLRLAWSAMKRNEEIIITSRHGPLEAADGCKPSPPQGKNQK